MYPPTQGSNIDIEALSGIFGSISIACWVVVFSPQIIENFRRSSADGLSLIFIVVWLLGDVFNILGAVLQGVLPTMTILAVYYTLADIVLLGQCFYYRGFTLSDAPAKPLLAPPNGQADDEEETFATAEETPLLNERSRTSSVSHLSPAPPDRYAHRASSTISIQSYTNNVDITHLSPATPLIPPPRPTDSPAAARTLKPRSTLASIVFNLGALILVCAVGAFGWWLSVRSNTSTRDNNHDRPKHQHHAHHHNSSISPSQDLSPTTTDSSDFNLWGQIFGYLCAILYLGSRIPQLLLNHRRKSTEGVSMLFFLFACVGNLTYVLSIFAYEPACARFVSPLLRTGGGRGGDCADGEWAEGYARYVGVNASWLIGSAGTLALDLGIFAQFWKYRGREALVDDGGVVVEEEEERGGNEDGSNRGRREA